MVPGRLGSPIERMTVGASSTYFQLRSHFRCMKNNITHRALATAMARTTTATTPSETFKPGRKSAANDATVQKQRIAKTFRKVASWEECSWSST